MRKYFYEEAKELITSICTAAELGAYDTREKFDIMMQANPTIAVQGYNAFGKIFFWNGPSTHLYGHKEHDAVNQEIFDLIIPLEMRQLARDIVAAAPRTGKMLPASACELLHKNGEDITVFSGHLVFRWESASAPEFYCLDVEIARPKT